MRSVDVGALKFSNTWSTSNITTSTITSPTITITDDLKSYSESSIQLGDQVLNESNVEDILTLLEVVKRLDKSDPIWKDFMAIKIRNKLTGKTFSE